MDNFVCKECGQNRSKGRSELIIYRDSTKTTWDFATDEEINREDCEDLDEVWFCQECLEGFGREI